MPFSNSVIVKYEQAKYTESSVLRLPHGAIKLVLYDRWSFIEDTDI